MCPLPGTGLNPDPYLSPNPDHGFRYWGNDFRITVRNPEGSDDLKVLYGHRPRTCEELQARHGVLARHEKDIVGKWFGALQESLFGLSSNPAVPEAGQPLGKEVPSASCCRRFVLGLKAAIGLGQQELVDGFFHGKIVTFSTEEDGAADKLKAASYNAKDYERDQSDKAKVRFHEADRMCRELVAKELKTKHLSNLKQAEIELDSMLDTLHSGLMDEDRPTFCNIEAFVTALNDPVVNACFTLILLACHSDRLLTYPVMLSHAVSSLFVSVSMIIRSADS